ncbi:hypothetical protein TNIN_100061 [Trichonephila inaurata madagascariensis]|uniref:Uncharacterized protein n=1 Tax=Trichonephila inaurata madagascariensis TaxID=2747483 RepID=A0A8X6YCR8_9ARAC|nr:hypothetical protein TNIN_100061 [Trichonephila inaurata madagascariensis]
MQIEREDQEITVKNRNKNMKQKDLLVSELRTLPSCTVLDCPNHATPLTLVNGVISPINVNVKNRNSKRKKVKKESPLMTLSLRRKQLVLLLPLKPQNQFLKTTALKTWNRMPSVRSNLNRRLKSLSQSSSPQLC